MKRDLRFYAAPALLSSIALLSPAQAQKQNPKIDQGTEDDVIRVNTTLVTVPVSVMDRQGRFIPDLKQSQFHIFEDGIAQEIAYFESAEKPFTVALLLDTSDSTKFKLQDIKAAAAAFLSQLRSDDRVIVVAFDKHVKVMAEATSDRLVLNEAINQTRTGGGTSLYEALDLVISRRLGRIHGRKAIVLFTDGVDTTSKGATYQSTLYHAEELDALAYAIQYNTYEDAAAIQKAAVADGQMVTGVVTAKGEQLDVAYERANRYLRLLASNSGGRFFYADSPGHLAEAFARIAAELRQQYSLGYYPKKQASAGVKRELKVSVTVPNVVVRSRKSYIYRRADRQ